MVLTRAEVLERFRELNVWKRGDERAPHKPLLVLLALGRLERGEGRLARFEEIEEPLRRLLMEFGPSRKTYHAEFPFWYLQHDEVWEVPDASQYALRKGGHQPSRRELLEREASGGFPAEAFELLRSDRRLRSDVARSILAHHFPESLHQDVLDAVGLDLGAWVRRDPRSADFRREVLQAYGRRCAVCGFDAHIESGAFGLDAAHVKWREAGGPDVVENGISMCVLHHRAFDRGVFTIDPSLAVLVSADLAGTGNVDALFFDLHGQHMREPHAHDLAPRTEFLDWHRREVFREPPRGSSELSQALQT